MLGLPLQVVVELDALGMFRGEPRDRRRARIAIGFGPRGPSPDRGVVAVEVLVQRIEQRMQTQRLAALRLTYARNASARASPAAR